MKPDQDIELLKIEDSYRRCDACMAKYPTIGDEVCNTCEVNQIKTDEDKKRYIEDAIKNPTSFGIPGTRD